jgi:hypothetical protein
MAGEGLRSPDVSRRAPLLLLLAAAACNAPQPCPEPLVECNGQCVDTASDQNACGSCGVKCATGQVCSQGACSTDVRGPCATRTGGAFVTLGACGSAVKLWFRTSAFVDEAATYVGTTALPRTPLLTIVEKTDCDSQWSWTVDDLDASWVTSVSVVCTAACPSVLEAAVHGGTLPTGTVWCPTPSSSLVLSVDRRP